MSSTKKPLSDRLRQRAFDWRIEHGETIAGLARRAGMPRSRLSEYLNGGRIKWKHLNQLDAVVGGLDLEAMR